MEDLIKALKAAHPSLETTEFRGQNRVIVPLDEVYALLGSLKNEHGFEFLSDITCVDYLNYRGARNRFGLTYVLTRIDPFARIVVRTYLDEPELTAPSVYPLWEAADWLEREVWDMFGIEFKGHPDLRRILTPEEFTAHALRKDYPLQGRGERHNFPVIKRNQA